LCEYFSPATEITELVIEGSRNKGRSGIAVDSMFVQTGGCPPFRNNDFEKNFNTYQNKRRENESDAEWSIKVGSTATSNTGPSADHTLSTIFGIQLICT